MVGVLDIETAQRVLHLIDGNGASSHQCATEYELRIGEIEANLIRKFDPELAVHFEQLGVAIVPLEIADLDMVGELIDEVNDQLKHDHSQNDQFLYKHSIAVRLDAPLLAIAKTFFENRIGLCSKIFGNKLVWYKG